MTEIEKALSIKNPIEAMAAVGEIVWNKAENDEEFKNLTEPEKKFLYMEMLDGQVFNGGFHQFFFNLPGEYAHKSLDAFREIGANNVADIVSRAIELFPVSPVPKDVEKRRSILWEIDEDILDQWCDLEDEYDQYEEHIAHLILEYVKRNKTHFG